MGAGIFKREVVIIGGGPAGLAAAISAKRAGAKDVLLIERDKRLGGILNQCIHDGFGLHRFKETLSGPEYAKRFIDQLESEGVDYMLSTMVTRMGRDRSLEVSSVKGLKRIEAKAIVLSMGCRERTHGAIMLPGTRPSGIYTAGQAQNLINLQNIMVGKRAVILGSGDIGLIMARRLTLEGCEVLGVYEILPYPSGLPRNIQQCLLDYGIPLHLSTTVVEIHGEGRLSGVTVAKVDGKRQPIPTTSSFIPCDTLLLSVGLIPENELSREAGITIEPMTGGPLVDDTLMTSIEGVFACGNVLQVHDLVDHVSEEGELAGSFAARFSQRELRPSREYAPIVPGLGIRYCLPQRVSKEMDFYLSLRVNEPMRDKKILLLDENRKRIMQRSFPRLHPAVMVRFKVMGEKIAKAKQIEVSVE
ncbi:MAG: NAD(P)/FAD-dependent oxidoreductase [Desulfatiglandales bacterium]